MTERRIGFGAARQTGQVIRIARIACSAVMIATYSQSSPDAWAADPVMMLLLAHFALAIAGTLAVRRLWWLDPLLAPAETLFDFLAVSVALHATDALLSPFFVFGIPLFMSALLRWGWREAVIVAAAFVAVYFASGWTDWQQRGVAAVDYDRLLARIGGFAVIVLVAVWVGRHHHVIALSNPRVAPGDGDRTRTLLLELRRLMGADTVTLATMHDRSAVAIRSTDPAVDGMAARFTSDQLLVITRRFLFQLDPPRKVIDRGWLFGRGALSRRVGAYEVLASLHARQGLVVPISVQDVRGIVVIARRTGMSSDMLDLAPWIASQVAAAFLDELRFRSVRREALMEARLRAAQDVHDTVVQALAGTVFRLQALKSWITAGRDAGTEIDRLSEDVRNAQTRVRDYIGRLRTHDDSEAPCDLLAEIEAASEMSSRTWGIASRTVGPAEPIPAPAWLGQELAMVVSESASNAARHGDATEIAFRLTVEEGMIELTIEDDGRGFPKVRGPAAAPWSLNRRVLALGGTLTLHSSGRTRIVVNIPFEGQSDQA